jgi:Calcineurin-like phosphoesterase
MLLRIMSDIHLEFSDFKIPDLDTDRETVLVLAGDIGLVHKANLKEYYIPFLSRANIQFRKTILIMGNHEHYGGSFRRTRAVLQDAIGLAQLENIVLLEKETYLVDDVAFICATMWTDCDKHSPFAHHLFSGMSDSRVIRTGPNETLPYERKFSAEASWVDHMYATRFIFREIEAQRAFGRKPVVVTHHGPTMQSIHPIYAGSNMNMFYASELTNEIMNTNPILWVHGHTHHQFDYLVDDTLEHCQTRVITNPRGYHGHEDTSGFNETLLVEV